MIDNIQDNEVDYSAASEINGPAPPRGARRRPEAQTTDYRNTATEAQPAAPGRRTRETGLRGAGAEPGIDTLIPGMSGAEAITGALHPEED